ncbi:hypothetical protein OEG84_01645 [Hoeflea sp. G2-23]|uniref:DUF945 domain-containing protein n=1 Tax=Hoeflea algicola TaxID=2983763 RepID=A0ABT3Z3X0_9HYPH|nr:hypothetical protein [Hoeflea algicola]MCY0146455.1 hypothetical protein [Hoeflea algicola]
MRIYSHMARTAAATAMVVSLGTFSSVAFALDTDDFATKVAAIGSQGGTKMTFGAIETNGDTIVLKSVRLAPGGEPPVELGDVSFEGVEEEDDGAYSVELVKFPDVDVTNEGDHLSIVDIEIGGLYVPETMTYDTLDNILFYESMSTGPLKITHKGEEVFSMSGIELEVNRADDDSTVGLTLNGTGLRADIKHIDDPKPRQMLNDLGYETLTGDLALDVNWDVESGTVKLNEYGLTLNDVGKLAVQLEISGYTMEFIQAMQQAQAAAAANPDPEAAQQAMGFAMLGMLQQLTFKSASIRFDDASVTEKALAYAGKQQGISGEQMRQAVKGMMPLMLGQLGIPSLQQQISAAANIYLDNPGNLTVSAKPAAPVAVPAIMGAGMGDPRALVDLLNVQVTAND